MVITEDGMDGGDISKDGVYEYDFGKSLDFDKNSEEEIIETLTEYFKKEPIINKDQLTEDQIEELICYFENYNSLVKITKDRGDKVPEQYIKFSEGIVKALKHIFGDEIFNR